MLRWLAKQRFWSRWFPRKIFRGKGTHLSLEHGFAVGGMSPIKSSLRFTYINRSLSFFKCRIGQKGAF